jgi:hypothetical protein
MLDFKSFCKKQSVKESVYNDDEMPMEIQLDYLVDENFNVVIIVRLLEKLVERAKEKLLSLLPNIDKLLQTQKDDKRQYLHLIGDIHNQKTTISYLCEVTFQTWIEEMQAMTNACTIAKYLPQEFEKTLQKHGRMGLGEIGKYWYSYGFINHPLPRVSEIFKKGIDEINELRRDAMLLINKVREYCRLSHI